MTARESVAIDDPVIELYKLLKLAGFAASGGAAKALIANGQVRLNNRPETRKRKKVGPGDTVAIGDREFCVIRTRD